MNTVNKVFTCLCCWSVACHTACCIDHWHAIEACGYSYLQCGNCCWTVFAPICHSCLIGDLGVGMNHFVIGAKYCLYSCSLSFCAPIDGIYNCVKYIGEVCGGGVTGCADILKNVDFFGRKIREAFEIGETPQPTAKLAEYRP